MNVSILLVDDDQAITNSLERTLRKQPFDVMSANSPQEALDILDVQKMDILICDEIMPDMGGTELLSLVRRRYPDTIRIILTGKATLDTAIKAINQGEVYRFLTKPCSEHDLITTIKQGMKHLKLLRESNRLLKLYKKKSSLLSRIESKYPGIISDVENDEMEDAGESTITIPEQDKDFDTVLSEIENEISKDNL